MNTDVFISCFPMKNYALARIEGPLQIETIKSIIVQIITSTGFSSNISTIWDLSKADLSEFTYLNVKEVSAIADAFSSPANKIKVALVSTRDINLILLNLYRHYEKDKKRQIRVFTSLEDAKSWLMQPI